MTLVEIFQQLLPGMGRSIGIFFCTLVLSLPLGLLVAFGRMSRFRVVQLIFKAYISIMRGTPLMLQLMVVYFGPYFIFGIRITDSYRLYAVLIAFAINYAAYFAEIYRGGIESMPLGQYEAAQLLGYTKMQTFFRIILLRLSNDPSVGDQRGDHPGEGYIPFFRHRLSGDVYHGQSAGRRPEKRASVYCRRHLLLYL